jgi:hypothetical protein
MDGWKDEEEKEERGQKWKGKTFRTKTAWLLLAAPLNSQLSSITFHSATHSAAQQ